MPKKTKVLKNKNKLMAPKRSSERLKIIYRYRNNDGPGSSASASLEVDNIVDEYVGRSNQDPKLGSCVSKMKSW